MQCYVICVKLSSVPGTNVAVAALRKSRVRHRNRSGAGCTLPLNAPAGPGCAARQLEEFESMRISSFSLRLQPSLMEEAREVARSEGVSLNQLFNVAVAEKLATVRTERGFQERIRRAGRWEPEQTPDRAGIRNPSMGNDKISIARLPMLAATLAHTLRSIDKYHQREAQPAPPPDLAPEGQRAREPEKPAGRATPQFGLLKKRLDKIRSQ